MDHILLGMAFDQDGLRSRPCRQRSTAIVTLHADQGVVRDAQIVQVFLIAHPDSASQLARHLSGRLVDLHLRDLQLRLAILD